MEEKTKRAQKFHEKNKSNKFPKNQMKKTKVETK